MPFCCPICSVHIPSCLRRREPRRFSRFPLLRERRSWFTGFPVRPLIAKWYHILLQAFYTVCLPVIGKRGTTTQSHFRWDRHLARHCNRQATPLTRQLRLLRGPGALAMKVRMRITLTTQTDITLSNPYKITGGTAGQARSATQEKILIHSSSHAKRRNF
jgi:hypothetical protein